MRTSLRVRLRAVKFDCLAEQAERAEAESSSTDRQGSMARWAGGGRLTIYESEERLWGFVLIRTERERVKSEFPMPSGKYYRTQAQLFAGLAVTTRDPQIAARYNEMALEQLAKAEEVEPRAGQRSAPGMAARNDCRNTAG